MTQATPDHPLNITLQLFYHYFNVVFAYVTDWHSSSLWNPLQESVHAQYINDQNYQF